MAISSFWGFGWPLTRYRTVPQVSPLDEPPYPSRLGISPFEVSSFIVGLFGSLADTQKREA